MYDITRALITTLKNNLRLPRSKTFTFSDGTDAYTLEVSDTLKRIDRIYGQRLNITGHTFRGGERDYERTELGLDWKTNWSTFWVGNVSPTVAGFTASGTAASEQNTTVTDDIRVGDNYNAGQLLSVWQVDTTVGQSRSFSKSISGVKQTVQLKLIRTGATGSATSNYFYVIVDNGTIQAEIRISLAGNKHVITDQKASATIDNTNFDSGEFTELQISLDSSGAFLSLTKRFGYVSAEITLSTIATSGGARVEIGQVASTGTVTVYYDFVKQINGTAYRNLTSAGVSPDHNTSFTVDYVVDEDTIDVINQMSPIAANRPRIEIGDISMRHEEFALGQRSGELATHWRIAFAKIGVWVPRVTQTTDISNSFSEAELIDRIIDQIDTILMGTRGTVDFVRDWKVTSTSGMNYDAVTGSYQKKMTIELRMIKEYSFDISQT